MLSKCPRWWRTLRREQKNKGAYPAPPRNERDYTILFFKHQWNTRWGLVRKHDNFTWENNMLSSHVKRSTLLWLHDKSRLSQQKTILKSDMVWYFTDFYIINSTFLGDTTFLFSCWKNISLVRSFSHSWNIFQHSKTNFVSPPVRVISSIYFLVIITGKRSEYVLTESFALQGDDFQINNNRGRSKMSNTYLLV